MTKVSELVSQNVGNAIINSQTWGGLIYNVKAYGAKGDGVTDDTAAINAALAAAVSNGGGVVFLPKGTFIYSSSIPTINTDGIYFVGAGRWTTILRHTSNTVDLFTFGALGGAVVHGVGVSNMQIVHNQTTRNAGITIKIVNAQRIYMQDLEIAFAFNMFAFGDPTDTNTNTIVLRDIVGNCQGAGVALDIKGMNGLHLLGLQINNNTGSGGTAINFPMTGFGMDTLTMDNCLFQRFAYGMKLNPSSATVQNGFISNTIFDQHDTNPIFIQPTSTGIVTRFEFNSCWFNSINDHGIFTDGYGSSKVDGLYFTKCRIINAGKAGYFCQSTLVNNVDLIECKISGCSASVSNTNAGVYMGSGVSKFKIQNCRIGAEGLTVSNQNYGISLGGNNDRYLIQGNDLTGNLSGALADNLGTFTKKINSGNLGYNPVGSQGAPAMPASTVAQANNGSVVSEVRVNGGTVTQISKNGSITGATSGLFILYPAETLAITYTVAPTWTWFGL